MERSSRVAIYATIESFLSSFPHKNCVSIAHFCNTRPFTLTSKLASYNTLATMDSTALSTMTLGDLVDPSRRALGSPVPIPDEMLIAGGLVFLLRLFFEFFDGVCFEGGKKGKGMSMEGGKKGGGRRELTSHRRAQDQGLGEFIENFPFDDFEAVFNFVCFLFITALNALFEQCEFEGKCTQFGGPVLTTTSTSVMDCSLDCLGIAIATGASYTGGQFEAGIGGNPGTCTCYTFCSVYEVPATQPRQDFLEIVTFTFLESCEFLGDFYGLEPGVADAAAAATATFTPPSFGEWTEGVMKGIQSREGRR
jgi:hypothetical protein